MEQYIYQESLEGFPKMLDKYQPVITAPEMMKKILGDVFECMEHQDVFSVLLSSDIKDYRKL